MSEERILHEDEYTQLVATDERDEVSGASHHYVVRGVPPKPKRKTKAQKEAEAKEDAPDPEPIPVFAQVDMQEGARKENPVNGMTDEDLARILVDRMEGFEEGSFPSKYTTTAKSYFKEGLQWLEDRKKDREKRGVEGKNEA